MEVVEASALQISEGRRGEVWVVDVGETEVIVGDRRDLRSIGKPDGQVRAVRVSEMKRFQNLSCWSEQASLAARGEAVIGSPSRGLIVGIWRMASWKSFGREREKRERMSVAIVRISSWPKRMPMHVREPPPKGM